MSDSDTALRDLALKLSTTGPVRTLSTPREISILFQSHWIARSTSAIYVWEHQYYPQFYVPYAAITLPASASLTSTHTILDPSTSNPLAEQLTLTLADRSTREIIHFTAPSSATPEAAALKGYVKFAFGAMDTWLEEAQPILVHPKDPYKRIEIVTSTRRVKVRVGGQQVADSVGGSLHLYETGLPPRYYLPFSAVDASVLRKSETRTLCPYKGEAEYYHVELDGGKKRFEDIVWTYLRPTTESGRVEGLLCFYNEKVEIELDGKVLEKPEWPPAKK